MVEGKKRKEARRLVLPGEEIIEGMEYIPGDNVYRDGKKIIGTKVGLVDVSGKIVKVIPLVGYYMPKKGDMVIGRITEVVPGFGWIVDFGWIFSGVLHLREVVYGYDRGDKDKIDMGRHFNYGDYVLAQVIYVTQKKVDLSVRGQGLKRLGVGRIVRVNPAKVPRLIGKAGSMINQLKDLTKAKIVVGQNGWVWISADNVEEELRLVEAIKLIERESHHPGLTEKVKEFLEKGKKKK